MVHNVSLLNDSVCRQCALTQLSTNQIGCVIACVMHVTCACNLDGSEVVSSPLHTESCVSTLLVLMTLLQQLAILAGPQQTEGPLWRLCYSLKTGHT